MHTLTRPHSGALGIDIGTARHLPSGVLSLLLAVILLMIAAPALLMDLESYPAIWLDEGYTLNTARTVLETGQYGTFSSEGIHLYDPAVATGAPLVVPIAIAFGLFGRSLLVGRLVIVAFAFVAVSCLFLMSSRLHSPVRGLIIGLIVMAFPTLNGTGFLYMSRQVMGEIPALALMLIAWLLWWRSWSEKGVGFALLSGLFLGLSLLTKLQVAVPLAASMLLFALVSARRFRSRFWHLLLPVVIAAVIYGLWLGWSWKSTPEGLRQLNQQHALEGALIHFLAGVFPGKFTNSAFAILGLAGLTALIGTIRILRRPPGMRLTSPAARTEFSVILFVVIGACWASIFSIGWTRYYFSTLVFSLVMLAGYLCDLTQPLWSRLSHTLARHENRLKIAATAALALVITPVEFIRIAPRASDFLPARSMVQYIDANVARTAVIETWEWQMDPIGQHRRYHYPDQDIFWDALRQYSRLRTFALDYDALNADPDYLLIGPFGAWTEAYRPEIVDAFFIREAQYDPYVLYRRIRADQSSKRNNHD